MNGSITLCREAGSNTNLYFTLYYDNTDNMEKEAVRIANMIRKNEKKIVEINSYERRDGYKAIYITIRRK